MRWLAGGAVAASTTALVACGGGGDDGVIVEPDNGDPGPIGDTLTDSQRSEAIANVEQKSSQLMATGVTPLQFAVAMAAHLRTLPAYAETGFDEECANAWGVFKDGRTHIVVNTLVPKASGAPALAAPTAQALATGVPASRDARLFHIFGKGFDGQGVVDDLMGWLTSAGYAVRSGAEGDGRLSALRAIKGDGFFYINTHGGTGRDAADPVNGAEVFSIQSSTLVNPDLEKTPEMKDDIAKHRLTYFTAPNGEMVKDGNEWKEVSDTRYGITANFVDAYWRFEKNSVVFINACTSGLAVRKSGIVHAGPFHDACFKHGAGVYLGWTQVVSGDGAYKTARYFADRLLGANDHEAAKPKQRAFPVDAVLRHMKEDGRTTDAAFGAEFVSINPAGASLLVPGIRRLIVDEFNDQLVLLGDFGTREAENACKVTIDGTEPAIVSWAPDRVVCALPRTGGGSCGAVRAQVGEHASNARWITRWKLLLDFRWAPPDRPGLKLEGTATIHHRADIGKVRDKCGEAPYEPVSYAVATLDSELPLTASGSHTEGEDCTYTWRGSETYAGTTVRDGRVLAADLKLDTEQRTGALGLALGVMPGTPPRFTETGCGNPPSPVPASFKQLDKVEFFGRYDGQTGAEAMTPFAALVIGVGADYTLAAGTHENEEVQLKWAAAKPLFVPSAADVL